MSKATSRRVVFTSLFGLSLLVVTSIFFVNCASHEPANSPAGSCSNPRQHHEHHRHPPRETTDGGPPDYITCRAPLDCEESDWYPECGDYDFVTCVAPAGETSKQCIFRVADTEGCFCLERDIRNCTQSNSSPGIQHCLKTATDTTSWGGCGGL